MAIRSVDYHSENAPEEFAVSLKETGFGVLKNHPIPWSKITQVYDEWEKLFTSEDKHNYAFDEVKQEGYVGTDVAEIAKGETVKDIKEFYQMYFPWGRYPDSLSDVTREVFDATFKLAGELLGWIEQYLPEEIKSKLKRSLSSMICIERTQYRILYYPALKGDEEVGAIRAAAHEDINLITILPTATQSGLEAKDAHGNWVKVPSDPESLIVNVGDMLQELTDHYYISTSHRVTKPEGEKSGVARMSTPLFLHPHAGDFLSDKYPTAKEYLDERLRELGILTGDTETEVIGDSE